jgi:LPS-assembly lipoprotein
VYAKADLMRCLKLFLLAGFPVVFSACGFHMQGRVGLGPEFAQTYVTGIGERDRFVVGLKDQLRVGGAALSGDIGAATAVVSLSDDEGRRVLSVSSDGEVSEYELFYKMTIEVRGKEKVLLPSQTLVVTREVLFDENAVLGNEAEQDVLLDEMKQDMVRLVMLRLRSVSPGPG